MLSVSYLQVSGEISGIMYCFNLKNVVSLTRAPFFCYFFSSVFYVSSTTHKWPGTWAMSSLLLYTPILVIYFKLPL